ncbi:MAG: Fe-S cluster assembly protein SufD [Hyphomonadaceae bacterium]|nr:MAG: Fe-S cluster assembly protein SufD [Hyphomonadaceae bacterium]KAF0186323.1 MAG: Fe-S cluster assembly protein SufD [Hyphomonadaceae bacterium]
MALTNALPDIFAPTKVGARARDYFSQNGLPNKRNEDFHFTDLSRGLSQETENAIIFEENPAPIAEIEMRLFEDRIEVIGQKIGVCVEETAPNLDRDVFQKLIGGMTRFSKKIVIDANCNVAVSIIRFPNSRANIEIAVGENATLNLVEKQICGGGLSSFSCSISQAENSQVQVQTQLLGNGVDLSLIKASLESGANYSEILMASGGKMVRRNLEIKLQGEGAKAEFGGVYLLANSHFDFSSNIEHLHPNCTSHEVMRGVVANGAHAVFQGKILVARDAQKTMGNMEHRALMLEDGARVNAKPTLEIYADDVECSHANTIGALDESALFYMQSRGITKASAKALLTQAFLAQVFDAISDEAAKNEILGKVEIVLRGLIK